MSNQVWRTFWFEGNTAWGLIDSPKEWQRIKDAYVERRRIADVVVDADAQSSAVLLEARRGPDKATPNGPVPNYGFRREHRGDETLNDHFNPEPMEA